jgi:hypothetical protein
MSNYDTVLRENAAAGQLPSGIDFLESVEIGSVFTPKCLFLVVIGIGIEKSRRDKSFLHSA